MKKLSGIEIAGLVVLGLILFGKKKEKGSSTPEKSPAPAPNVSTGFSQTLSDEDMKRLKKAKPPKFLSGQMLQHFKDVDKSEGLTLEDLQKLTIIERNVTASQFDEVLAALGSTRSEWEFLKNQI